MDALTLVHQAALLLCLLVLPRLTSPPDFVANASEDVEDLALTRLGHVPGHGLYVCLARTNGTAPDLALHYTASYTHGNPTRHTSCTATLAHRQTEPGLFCLPPCPGVETIHPRRIISLVVTGHDRTTGEAMAALVDFVTLTDVAPTVVQTGRGVVEVWWTCQVNSTFIVQLWHHPHGAGEGSAPGDGTAEERTSATVAADETLVKIRQCYHDGDNDDDDDDDNDDDEDDNDDDDHEEDSDDFLKWKRWRRCVALHAPRAAVPPAAEAAVLVHTSPILPSLANTTQCHYYITNVPASSGSLSVALQDVTHSPVLASHTTPAPLREWRDVAVEVVVITRACVETSEVEPAPRLRAVTVTVLDGAAGRDTAIGEQSEAGGEVVVPEEANVTEGDLQVLVINGHDHSEALRSLPGECGPPRLPGAAGVVCSVRALETLVDPEGQGPVSSLLLLLASQSTAASTLLAITDVQVRVRQAGRGAVLVLWDRDASVQEFAVSVAPEVGSVHSTVTVTCHQRGSDCVASFEGLAPGRYIAEVSYERQTRVLLREPFVVERMAA